MSNEDDQDPNELWLHGVSDEHPDRQCPNCGCAIDVDRLKEPDEDKGILLCPECHAELPWSSITDVPRNDWFNWACLEKEDYPARECFDEPDQKALSITVSLADPARRRCRPRHHQHHDGDVLVKVHNREASPTTATSGRPSRAPSRWCGSGRCDMNALPARGPAGPHFQSPIT